MGFERSYRIKCDGCGRVHDIPEGYDTPRRARAAAKKTGWGRANVVVGQGWYPDADEPSGRHYYDDVRGRDFCPKCIAEQDTPDALAAHWPEMPELEGIDRFSEYPVTGGSQDGD